MLKSYYLACKSSQQSVLPLISLEVFLLYVYGDVVSSWCCCWVRKKYNGPLYINSCPVPACHGFVLVVPARPGFLNQLESSAIEKRAGQPVLVTSSAVWPSREALKSSKWSPHPPLAQSMASDLESEAEVWFPPRLASTGTLAGGGVCTWRGWEGALPWLLWWGGEGEGGWCTPKFLSPALGHKVPLAHALSSWSG